MGIPRTDESKLFLEAVDGSVITVTGAAEL
jgi:hypothetical protein